MGAVRLKYGGLTLMLKYVIFALVFIILIINFTVKSIALKLFKKELKETQEVAAKSVCFLLALAGVIYIIFVG